MERRGTWEVGRQWCVKLPAFNSGVKQCELLPLLLIRPTAGPPPQRSAGVQSRVLDPPPGVTQRPSGSIRGFAHQEMRCTRFTSPAMAAGVTPGLEVAGTRPGGTGIDRIISIEKLCLWSSGAIEFRMIIQRVPQHSVEAPFRHSHHALRTASFGFHVGLAAVLSATPVTAQQSTLASCYDLAIGPWPDGSHIEGDSLTFAPPPRVMMDTLSTYRGPVSAGMVLREAPGTIPSVHPFSYWQLNRDSVDLVWSTGFAGLSARLAISADSLHGIVRTFSDALHLPPLEARITALPVRCDEEPPVSLESQRRVPTGLTLRDGGSVRLGQYLGEVEQARVGEDRRTARLTEPLARPFTSVPDVQLMADTEGRIGILRFPLPTASDWDAVVRSITAEFGRPNSRASHRAEDIESETLEWSNRMASFSMHRSRGVGESWHASVVIANPRFRP